MTNAEHRNAGSKIDDGLEMCASDFDGLEIWLLLFAVLMKTPTSMRKDVFFSFFFFSRWLINIENFLESAYLVH